MDIEHNYQYYTTKDVFKSLIHTQSRQNIQLSPFMNNILNTSYTNTYIDSIIWIAKD